MGELRFRGMRSVEEGKGSGARLGSGALVMRERGAWP